MKRFALLACALLLATLASAGQTQTQTEQQKRSRIILEKARHLDLLNHMVPLQLTKEQIKDILPVIEKCRAKVREIESFEAKELAKFEARITEVVDKGVKKEEIPPRDFLREVNRLFNALAINRDVAINENVATMMEFVNAKFNAGQKATASKSLDPKAFYPNVDKEKWTQEDGLKLYCRDILLDPLAYDLLIRIQKERATPNP